MAHFINVILPIPLEHHFTYSVTLEESLVLKPGMRVCVPFGKSKIYTGLVQSVHTMEPAIYEAKEIDQILDEAPIVTITQLKHWNWIATYYMCTLGEVLRSALPNAFLLESETLVLRNKQVQVVASDLKDDEFLVVEALEHQSMLKVHEVAAIVDRKNAVPVLNRLLEKNIIKLREEVFEQYKPKLVTYIRLGAAYTEDTALENILKELTSAPKQSQAVLAMFQLQGTANKPVPVSDLLLVSECSKAVIKALVVKGVLEEYSIRKDRITFGSQGDLTSIKKLNEYQQNALNDIKIAFSKRKVTLLKGVTSSGKTEVYVQLILEALAEGSQVLYLLPEIALTTQLITRLQEYFGEKIAVYHSKYNVQERVEVWNNVLHNKPKAQIVIGARSAIFLPFKKLGLVIIDEEHESSFKQFDPAPRYHGRDTAIVLGNLHKAQVLLGSATPSIETFYNVASGKYGYAEITRRFGDVLMPDMEIVDIKEAHRKKRMKGHFSERLLEEMAAALNNNEQIILFQNRRGYAPILECLTCGHTPQCPNCDVSLTYHQYRKQLRCHYCSYHAALPESCQACGGADLDTKGFGTEQIEEEVVKLFPEIKVGRMDLDTTRGKHAYEKIITGFEQQKVSILIGTQMLTKGLDFRNVSLVGVMNADALLNFPDYRAHERSFQLLTQVSGRAGRTKKRGKVMIQTFNPYHQIIKQVTTGDYNGMYLEQLYEREQFKFPPNNKILKITFKHKNYNLLNEASDWFTKTIKTVFTGTILGPEYPPVARIRNQYLKNVILKIGKNESPSQIKSTIRRIEKSFKAVAMFRSVRVIYHVDHI